MDASLNLEGRHPFCFRLDSAVIVIVNILGNRLGEVLKGGMWTKRATSRNRTRKNRRTPRAVPRCRPSVLAALEEKSDKPEPVKPFCSYYDKDGDAR